MCFFKISATFARRGFERDGCAAAAPVVAPVAAAPVEVMTTHTVKSGDSLNDLARKYYGKSTEWKKILAANADLLQGDHRKLRPGQELTIPK